MQSDAQYARQLTECAVGKAMGGWAIERRERMSKEKKQMVFS